MLKKMNEYKTTMVASLTHELRTPLNGITGLIECVIQSLGDKSEIVKEYLQPAINCAHILLS